MIGYEEESDINVIKQILKMKNSNKAINYKKKKTTKQTEKLRQINKAALTRPWESCVPDFVCSLATVESVSNKV